MPKAKYEFQSQFVGYSQAFETKSLKIWKTSNFSIKIVTIIFVYYCIFLRFSFYPTQIWNGTISHITRSLDPIFCQEEIKFCFLEVGRNFSSFACIGFKVKRTLTGKIFAQANKVTSARMDAICLKSFTPLPIEAAYMFRFQQEMI